MEQSIVYRVGILFSILYFLLLLGSVEAYKNYTVGDSLGWYDNLQKPNVNYQKWVAGKKFSLGDYLIFNTDSNHSVVQTYNFTTYKRCDYDNALDNDTVQWSAGDPSATAPTTVSLPVPLVKEGMTYFFSSHYDGEQCKHGQRFKINVTHGQGLQDSLKNPSDQAPAPNSADVNNDDSAPDTEVSTNFNHPQEGSDDVKEDSGSPSLSVIVKKSNSKLFGILILLGLLMSWGFSLLFVFFIIIIFICLGI